MLARCPFTFTTCALKVSGEIEAEFAPIGAKSVLKKMLSYRNSVPFYLPKGKALRLSLMLRLPFHRGFLKESWITVPASLNNGFTRLVSLVQLTIIELYPYSVKVDPKSEVLSDLLLIGFRSIHPHAGR